MKIVGKRVVCVMIDVHHKDIHVSAINGLVRETRDGRLQEALMISSAPLQKAGELRDDLG